MTKKRRKFMSKADDMLDLIKQFSNRKGYVSGLDSRSLAQKLGYNLHDVNKILFDLNKRGLLGFSTNRKEGEDGTILHYRLRLTKQGIDAVVGAGVPLDDEEPTLQQVADSHYPEVIEEPIDQIVVSKELAESLGLHPTPTITDTAEATPPPGTPPAPTPPRLRYPTLVTLLDRKRLAEQAAENLEALGADNLAIQALELASSPLTPLQKEIAQFFVDHPTFVEFALMEKKER